MISSTTSKPFEFDCEYSTFVAVKATASISTSVFPAEEFTAEQWSQMSAEKKKDWLDEKAFSSALEWAADNLGYGWTKLNQEGINS
jgi:hypothetical protein